MKANRFVPYMVETTRTVDDKLFGLLMRVLNKYRMLMIRKYFHFDAIARDNLDMYFGIKACDKQLACFPLAKIVLDVGWSRSIKPFEHRR